MDTGNLLFDQDVWPTFQSYLLVAHVRRGKVIRAFAEPLMLEGYRPRGIAGGVADHVAREAAGREHGPFLVEDGAMEVDLGRRARQRQALHARPPRAREGWRSAVAAGRDPRQRGARPRITLNLYRDTRGPSSMRSRLRLGPRAGHRWRSFRLDVTVPADVVAAAPFFRLPRPVRGRSTVDVDDVALVQWAGPQARPSLLYDWLLVIGRGVGTVRHDVLPGARAWSPLGPIRSTR